MPKICWIMTSRTILHYLVFTANPTQHFWSGNDNTRSNLLLQMHGNKSTIPILAHHQRGASYSKPARGNIDRNNVYVHQLFPFENMSGYACRGTTASSSRDAHADSYLGLHELSQFFSYVALTIQPAHHFMCNILPQVSSTQQTIR